MAVELPGRCIGEDGCKAPVLRMSRCVKHLREFEQATRDRLGLPPVKEQPKSPAPAAAPRAPAEKQSAGRADMADHRKLAAEPLPAKYLTLEEVEAYRRTAPRWLWLWDLLEN